jgi:hypothetical protein
VLGLSGSELKEAVSLSESVRHGLEEMSSARDDEVLRRAAAKFELSVGVSIGTAVRSLYQLESAIEVGDVSGFQEVNDMIDSMVDYLVVVIGMLETKPDRGGAAMVRLQRLRRDAGRLAQYVCQLTEGAP